MKAFIEHTPSGRKAALRALVDSGCSRTCLNIVWAKKMKWPVYKLKTSVKLVYADGRESSESTLVTRFRITVHGRAVELYALITQLGSADLYLGFDWLWEVNPQIDWKTLNVRINALVTTPIYEAEFPQVFSEADFEKLPPRREWDHAIELVEGSKPPKGKCYGIKAIERDALKSFVETNLKSNRIRPSKSPYASPFFFRDKPGSTELRGIQDYRRLNEITKPDRYPLPLISTILEKLKGARCFTKMDLRWRFNNVRIKEGDEEKAAFITPLGLFEPLVMQFGLRNAPPTFQRMMDDILNEEIASGYVVVFIDDILVFTEDATENRKWTRRVLRKLKDNHLYCRLSKCEFEKTEVKFLGLMISHGGIRVSDDRIRAILEEKPPRTKRGVQRFLGMANVYRRFIEGFARIAKPLHELTADKPFVWGDAQQTAFEELKARLVTHPVLATVADAGTLRVETDASDVATGAVLSQKQSDGTWRPIGYASKLLNPAERNYTTYDKELLAIMRALEEWRSTLISTTEPFEIWTDHRNLVYYRDPQKLTRKQVGWSAKLQDYNFVIRHISGKANRMPDGLLRPGEGDDEKKEPEKQTLLPKDVFIQSVIEMDNVGEFEQVMQEVHDAPVAGHPGITRTMAALKRRKFDMPKLLDHVKQYIGGCYQCQKTKPRNAKVNAPIEPTPIPTEPWEAISWDLIGPLPESNGYDAIMTVDCMLTKKARFVPTTISLDSEGAAKLMRDHIFREEGMPKVVFSDRGPQFVSVFMKELYRLLGVKGNPSTAYHPQTDGQSERMNREIERYLRTYISYHQDDWEEWLAIGEFAYNNGVHAATGHTPFYLNKGRHPRDHPDAPDYNDKVPAAEEFVKAAIAAREHAKIALAKAKEAMKRRVDKKRGPAIEYEDGQRV